MKKACFFITEESLQNMKVSEVKNLQTIPQNSITCENIVTYKKMVKYFNQLSIPIIKNDQTLTIIA